MASGTLTETEMEALKARLPFDWVQQVEALCGGKFSRSLIHKVGYRQKNNLDVLELMIQVAEREERRLELIRQKAVGNSISTPA